MKVQPNSRGIFRKGVVELRVEKSRTRALFSISWGGTIWAVHLRWKRVKGHNDRHWRFLLYKSKHGFVSIIQTIFWSTSSVWLKYIVVTWAFDPRIDVYGIASILHQYSPVNSYLCFWSIKMASFSGKLLLSHFMCTVRRTFVRIRFVLGTAPSHVSIPPNQNGTMAKGR